MHQVRSTVSKATHHRGFITGLGIGQIVSWGTMYYSFPLLAIPMAEAFKVDKPAVYLAATLGLIVSSITAYFVGTAIDRGYGRVIMTLGSALGGSLLLLWSQIQSLYALYAIFLGLGVALSMTLYEPGFAVTARRFGPDSRRGITTLTLWGGFASTVFIPITQGLINTVGWRDTLVILGLVNLVINTTLHCLVIDRGKDAPQVPSPSDLSSGHPVRWALRQPVFWGLLLSFTLYYGVFGAMTFHLYPLLLERGFDPVAVVAAIACIGPAQVAGRMVVSTLARTLPIRIIGAGIMLLMPVVIFLFNTVPVYFVPLAAAAMLWGATNGVITIVRGNAVLEMLTRTAYGAINGVMIIPVTLAIALAPVSAAALWSTTGSYEALYPFGVVLGIVAMICFWFAAFTAKLQE